MESSLESSVKTLPNSQKPSSKELDAKLAKTFNEKAEVLLKDAKEQYDLIVPIQKQYQALLTDWKKNEAQVLACEDEECEADLFYSQGTGWDFTFKRKCCMKCIICVEAIAEAIVLEKTLVTQCLRKHVCHLQNLINEVYTNSFIANWYVEAPSPLKKMIHKNLGGAVRCVAKEFKRELLEHAFCCVDNPCKCPSCLDNALCVEMDWVQDMESWDWQNRETLACYQGFLEDMGKFMKSEEQMKADLKTLIELEEAPTIPDDK